MRTVAYESMVIIPGIRYQLFPRIAILFHLHQPPEAPATERSPSMAGSLPLDDRGSSYPHLSARTIRHDIECDTLDGCNRQRPCELSAESILGPAAHNML